MALSSAFAPATIVLTIGRSELLGITAPNCGQSRSK